LDQVLGLEDTITAHISDVEEESILRHITTNPSQTGESHQKLGVLRVDDRRFRRILANRPSASLGINHGEAAIAHLQAESGTSDGDNQCHFDAALELALSEPRRER
jgi:hypothetical protein